MMPYAHAHVKKRLPGGLVAASAVWYIYQTRKERTAIREDSVRGGSPTPQVHRDLTMTDTPRSLLERLREEPDEESWKRLVALYTPLLSRWLGQAAVAGTDADDVMQEVFVALVRELPQFEHNQQRGAFRCWLRSILINRLRIYWSAKRTSTSAGDRQALDRLEDPASDLNRLWEREHDVLLAQRILQLIEKDFTASTWHVFRRVVLEGAKPAEVATETGLSVNAVLLAKSRVLRRARKEIAGLIDA